MARKPDPIPAFFDHYAPFTKALENYTLKAGMLLGSAEAFFDYVMDLDVEIPEVLTRRMKQSIADMRDAGYGNDRQD
jgi:hypothetical protein